MTRRAWCSSFALALSAAFVAVGGGIAQAATTCPAGSDRWNGSGAWSSAGGWSSGQVPQSQTNANFGYFGVPTDSGYETHGGFDALSGTIVNDGSITSETTGDETPNLLEGNFDNVGTLTVDNTLDGPAGNWTLGGSAQNGTGQQIALGTGSSGSGSLNLTGTIDNGGSFTIGDGISITATSGTDSGNGFLLGNDTLSPSGSGSGSFHFEDGSAQLGSNIASGYTVWGSGIPGFTHGNITAKGSYTNCGTLEFGSTDGTHGTLTVPSGDTFTNAGTLIFENTKNGPDGLSGALVNNGTVTADGQFLGNGTITNNGTVELTSASGQSSAASLTQGSGGTLLLDVTGGGSPTVPELQLTGAAGLGGTLKVVTTPGCHRNVPDHDGDRLHGVVPHVVLG